MCGCNGCCASISTVVRSVAWYCTYSLVVLLYTRQGWRSQGTGPSIDLAPPHRHEPIGVPLHCPRGECRPPFRLHCDLCLCLLLILFLVRCFLPAGAHCPEVPSLPVALAADPNSLSTSPQIRSAQGCRPEQTTTRTRTTTSTLLLHLLFWCFWTPSSIVSLSIFHSRPRLLLCLPPWAATNVSHTHHRLVLRLGLLRALHSRTRAQPRSIPTEHGITSTAQSSPSQKPCARISKHHCGICARPVPSCHSLAHEWKSGCTAAQPT